MLGKGADVNARNTKTSAAVLLFSRLRRPALPEALVPPDWAAQQVYDHHEVFMLHGQRCCYYRNPACGHCPVLDLCPYGRARSNAVGENSPPA